MLEAHGAGYRIGGKWLVRHVDLSVSPGEFLCIAGPNGAGKTTLLSLLSGEQQPSEGFVTLFGKDLRHWNTRELARRRAFLQQQRDGSSFFTVRETVLLGRIPHLHGWCEQASDRLAADRAMAQFDVTAFADRPYATLSGGEAARADLARVAAQEPALLLLDEPTNHLDLTHQYAILQTCAALAEAGAAVVAVLHDLNLAARFAGRILLLHKGLTVACGKPKDVLTPALVGEMYCLPCQIWTHPDGHPWVVPTPGEQPETSHDEQRARRDAGDTHPAHAANNPRHGQDQPAAKGESHERADA